MVLAVISREERLGLVIKLLHLPGCLPPPPPLVVGRGREGRSLPLDEELTEERNRGQAQPAGDEDQIICAQQWRQDCLLELWRGRPSHHVEENVAEAGAEVEVDGEDGGGGAHQDTGEDVRLVGEGEQTDGGSQDQAEEDQPVVKVVGEGDGVGLGQIEDDGGEDDPNLQCRDENGEDRDPEEYPKRCHSYGSHTAAADDESEEELLVEVREGGEEDEGCVDPSVESEQSLRNEEELVTTERQTQPGKQRAGSEDLDESGGRGGGTGPRLTVEMTSVAVSQSVDGRPVGRGGHNSVDTSHRGVGGEH